MENNICFLKVVLNHIEDKQFNNNNFRVYTFTDFSSGKSFDCWLLHRVDQLENIKILIQPVIVKFNVVVTDKKIKLVPTSVEKA